MGNIQPGHRIKSNVIPFVRPIPGLWKYVHDDASVEKPSWKYIDHATIGRGGPNAYVIWVKNPHFAYEHLSPFDPVDMTLAEFRRGY